MAELWAEGHLNLPNRREFESWTLLTRIHLIIILAAVIIVDAGSSGTRLFVYLVSEEWKAESKEEEEEESKAESLRNSRGPKEPPKIYMMDSWEEKGGIAKLAADRAPGDVEKYLKPIIDKAENFFGSAWCPHIHIYILGTAGMRDLEEEVRRPLEDDITAYLKDRKFAEGYYSYHTITGEEEAAYGWIAANWSLGTFVELKQQSPQKYGYLEMGGASAQIAFLPHKHELTPEQLEVGDMTRVTLGGVEFDLFLKTYDLGSNKAWNEYEQELISIGDLNRVSTPPFWTFSKELTAKQNAEYVDPDSPDGRPWERSGRDGRRVNFRGTGEFDSSRFQGKVRRVLNRLTPPQHARGSRLLNEDLIKTLKRRRFVGGANFWYSTRTVFGRDLKGNPKQGLFSFSEYDAEVNRTTMLNWPLLKFRLRSKDNIVGRAWFVAAWVKCVLAEGFGFDLVDQAVDSEHELSFRPYHGPKGEELTWTLGKAVQFVTGDVKIKPLALKHIMEKHKKAQVDLMDEKAARCQELALDYLSIRCSLPDGGDDQAPAKLDEKDQARANRLEELARAALATVWSLQQEADKLRRVDREGELLSPKEQLPAVEKLRGKISEAAKGIDELEKSKQEITDDNWQDMQKIIIRKMEKAIGNLARGSPEGTVTE